MRALTFIAILSAAHLSQAAPISFNVTDLGGFGGSTAVGFSINSAGLVVGWATTPQGDRQAFSSSGSGLTNLNPSGATESLASGVNGSGVIAGTAYYSGVAHGTIWGSNGTSDLGANSYAMGINSSGQVVGGNGQAFIDSNGQIQELGTLSGGSWSSAYAINDAGTVAGYGSIGSIFRGFVWTAKGGLVQLGTLGGNNSYAMGINASGEVVGNSNVASGYAHAFESNGGVLVDLGALGTGNSYAYGINDSGLVVGYSDTASGGTHAFVSIGGEMYDLNALIPQGSGWVLQEAYGINDSNQIVGTGTLNGVVQAFLLNDPPSGLGAGVPEPGTFVLICAGLALIAARRLQLH
jgi:probable HAF family extracellular repeat protein